MHSQHANERHTYLITAATYGIITYPYSLKAPRHGTGKRSAREKFRLIGRLEGSLQMYYALQVEEIYIALDDAEISNKMADANRHLGLDGFFCTI